MVRRKTAIFPMRWRATAVGVLALLLALPGWAREVSAVRMSSTPENTRLVFDLDGPVNFTLTTLDDPRRVVIEMRETRPGSNADPARLRTAGTPLAAVRSATQPDGSLRWVLELRDQRSARGFVLPPAGSHGHRLVIDIGGAPAGSSAAAASAPVALPVQVSAAATTSPPATTPRPTARVQEPVRVTASVPSGGSPAPVVERAAPSPAVTAVPQTSPVSAAPATAAPASAAPASAAPEGAVPVASATVPAAPRPGAARPAAAAEPASPRSVETPRPGPSPRGTDIVIAIDAGHGGRDPGAIATNGVHEKEIVLAIAKQVAQFINAEPGFKAVLTRSGDYYIPLRERTRIARAAGAHFFVSVHADAALNAAARGASVYALSERGATSETAKWLAERENNVDLVGGVSLDDKDRVLAGVLLDLSMTASLTESLELGGQVLEELGDLTRLHSRRVEQAGFMVLKSPDIPSILVETGFVSNPEDAGNLVTDAYRDRVARAIFRGIRDQALARPPQGTAVAQRLRARSAPVAVATAGDQERAAQADRAATGTASGAFGASGAACPCAYVVVRGDTLRSIAERFRVSASTIKRHNEMRSNRVRVGQTLRIPAAASES